MSLSSSIIAALVGAVIVLLGIFAKKRSPSAILNKRDKAIDKVEEAVRKDVEKLEKRRQEVLTHDSTADGLNDLIDRGDL